ncbi:cell division protein FtsZ [bacterium]|nr:cell division protein FtsZ [bacterium]
MPQVKPDIESFARIKVIGIGGSGCNAVSRMVRQKIRGVEFIGINTDAQALHFCKAPEKILIGKNVTKGLGTGMNVELGRKSIEESREEVEEAIKGADMVFATCGLGGGTGTSGIPVITEISKNLGALTVGIVTKPFSFEGKQRAEIAEGGLSELKDKVDSLIVIPNDRVLDVIDDKTTFLNAFSLIDNILSQAVQAISDLIVKPGIVNVDFADVKTIMKDSGWALMGIGRARGEGRMETAAKMAINSPLLEVSIDGAKGVLFTIAGGEDLTMKEIDQGAKLITKSVDPEAKIIFGAVIDESLRKGEVKITVIATGFNHVPEIKDNNLQQEKSKIEEELDNNEWDIPAFLRKKQK